MSGCTFLKDIYGWLWLFRRYFWVGVTVYSTFMGGCDCLEHFYGCGWVWVDVGGCGQVWLGVDGWVKWWRPLLLTLLLNSKNLLTNYEQLSYYQFNVT